jgi:hypothetical protein
MPVSLFRYIHAPGRAGTVPEPARRQGRAKYQSLLAMTLLMKLLSNAAAAY